MNYEKKISIIEDNREFREALEMVINFTEGFHVIACYENAITAVKKLPHNIPDAVLVDINLPDNDGIYCVTNLKNKFPEVHFIMCTSHEDDDKIFESLKAGACGYLLKTDGPSAVIEGLKDVFNGGSPMSGSIARKVVSSFSTKSLTKENTEKLTSREMEILELLANGLLNKEVAEKLFISSGTVKKHIQNIYEKLHVNNRIEATNWLNKNK